MVLAGVRSINQQVRRRRGIVDCPPPVSRRLTTQQAAEPEECPNSRSHASCVRLQAATGVGTRQCLTLARQSGLRDAVRRSRRISQEGPRAALPEAPWPEPEPAGLTPPKALLNKCNPAWLPEAQRRLH